LAGWLKVHPSNLARNGDKFPLEWVDRIISDAEALERSRNRDHDLGRVRIDNLARYLRDIQDK
jgi:hypothetical protein